MAAEKNSVASDSRFVCAIAALRRESQDGPARMMRIELAERSFLYSNKTCIPDVIHGAGIFNSTFIPKIAQGKYSSHGSHLGMCFGFHDFTKRNREFFDLILIPWDVTKENVIQWDFPKENVI